MLLLIGTLIVLWTGVTPLPAAAVILRNVPYVHQVYDTADSFNGGDACCNAAAALMAIQYYRRLPARPIPCTRGGPHKSDYGFYVSNVYSYQGHTFGERSSASGVPNLSEAPADSATFSRIPQAMANSARGD
jgi:hypothetical protein